MKTKVKQSIVALLMASFMALPAFAAGEPNNVANVEANSKDDSTLTITWDEALDSNDEAVDNYRIYYGTASVQKAEAAIYDAQIDTPDSSTSFDLSGLNTGEKYYVSVTAFDGGVESVEYSIEASGTPGGADDENADTLAPTVLNVIAANTNTVLVGFSEAIQLPGVLPEAAFVITEQGDEDKMLNVTAAKMYAEDITNKTIQLTTGDQVSSTNYVMTASTAVTDEAGNNIIEGNGDSGVFLGSGQLKPAADEEGAVTAEDLLLDETTPTSEDKNNDDTEADKDSNTDEKADSDEENALMEIDETAPEDITNLKLSFKEQVEKFMVMMTWEASLNTAKDLVDQMLYQSTDGGKNYNEGVSLGPDVTAHDVMNLEGGQEYTFKLTTKDETGNESVGAVKSIRLPQTGFGAGVLVLGSAFGANQLLRRRRKKFNEQA